MTCFTILVTKKMGKMPCWHARSRSTIGNNWVEALPGVALVLNFTCNLLADAAADVMWEGGAI